MAAKVVFVELVVLELGLKVGKESDGGVLGLAGKDKRMDGGVRLDFKPHGDEYAHVGGFGVTAGPHEDGEELRAVEDEVGGIDVEGGAGSGAAGGLVGAVVREVGLDEIVVVGARFVDTEELLGLGFGGEEVGSGGGFDEFDMGLPALKSFFGNVWHGVIRSLLWRKTSVRR